MHYPTVPYKLPQKLWHTLLQSAGFAFDSSVKNQGSELSMEKAESAVKVPFREVAAAVRRQSDFYIQQPNGKTPWDEKWCQWAQLLYYFPLNYLRSQKIVEEAIRQKFFSDLIDIWEFGAGLSPTLLALRNAGVTLKSTMVETSPRAKEMAENIHKSFILEKSSSIQHQQPSSNLNDLRHPKDFSISWSKSFEPTRKSLAIFSYSLTELDQLPKTALNAHALLILEPSTHQDGRRLLEIRQQLIDAGYFIWAPCVHQSKCPLKEESQKDWCHDRLHVELPEEFHHIENHLPFKNNTITMSYLLAKKIPPPPPSGFENKKNNESERARVVGDFLVEKGKVRQMICRGPEREFLTCLSRKDAKPIELARGDLIEIITPSDIKKIGKNELRYTNANSIKVVIHESK